MERGRRLPRSGRALWAPFVFGFIHAVRKQQRFIVGTARFLTSSGVRMENGLKETGVGLFGKPVLRWELVGALGPRVISELCVQDLVALSDMEVRTWKVARILKLSSGVQTQGIPLRQLKMV